MIYLEIKALVLILHNINKNTPGATIFLFTTSVACKKRGLKSLGSTLHSIFFYKA